MAATNLRTLFPYWLFQAAATTTAITKVEDALGIVLPEQLRELYLQSNGLREDRGNAAYLFPLDQDTSLLMMTPFMWKEFKAAELRPFVFFGSSSGDELWGIDWKKGDRIIAYHHSMEDEYEEVGNQVVKVYEADYSRYDAL